MNNTKIERFNSPKMVEASGGRGRRKGAWSEVARYDESTRETVHGVVPTAFRGAIARLGDLGLHFKTQPGRHPRLLIRPPLPLVGLGPGWVL